MEPLFEVRSVYSKPVLMEAYKKLIWSRTKFRVSIVVVSLLIFAITLFAWFILHSLVVTLIYLALAVLLVLRLLFYHKVYVNRYIKMDKGINLPGEKISAFFPDKIMLSGNTSTAEYKYSQITRFLESENLYILQLGAALLIIDKRGFVLGTSGDFKEFIKQNAPAKNK